MPARLLLMHLQQCIGVRSQVVRRINILLFSLTLPALHWRWLRLCSTYLPAMQKSMALALQRAEQRSKQAQTDRLVQERRTQERMASLQRAKRGEFGSIPSSVRGADSEDTGALSSSPTQTGSRGGDTRSVASQFTANYSLASSTPARRGFGQAAKRVPTHGSARPVAVSAREVSEEEVDTSKPQLRKVAGIAVGTRASEARSGAAPNPVRPALGVGRHTGIEAQRPPVYNPASVYATATREQAWGIGRPIHRMHSAPHTVTVDIPSPPRSVVTGLSTIDDDGRTLRSQADPSGADTRDFIQRNIEMTGRYALSNRLTAAEEERVNALCYNPAEAATAAAARVRARIAPLPEADGSSPVSPSTAGTGEQTSGEGEGGGLDALEGMDTNMGEVTSGGYATGNLDVERYAENNITDE